MRLFHRSPIITNIRNLWVVIFVFIVAIWGSFIIWRPSPEKWTEISPSGGLSPDINVGVNSISVILPALIVVLSAFSTLLVILLRSSRLILKITEAAEKIGTGEQHRRIEVQGPPDIRKLAAAFNSMAARLDENLAQQQKLQNTLKELSITDDLTGLYNRRELNRLLAQEFRRAKRFDRPLAIIILDIDHFKQVNDRYGHLVGDHVLGQTANLVARNTRTTNFIARYGGDEFVILLPETNDQNAFHAAERLRRIVTQTPFSAPTKNGGQASIQITISLGIAELNGEINSPKEFFDLADQALYKSKHCGRNQSQISTVRKQTAIYDQ